MTLSEKGLEFLKKREGYKEVAYRDSGGVWTIGHGTTRIYGRKVKKGDTCTEHEAELWLLEDTQFAEDVINNTVKVKLNQNQFDALVSFVYNIGTNGWKSSTLLRYLNENRIVYSDLFLRWNKVTINGKKIVVDGLTNRRKLEYQLFIQ